MQALSLGQSEFVTHSGRQLVYGSPKYSGKHMQEPAPLRSLQIALAPHGDGLHGFLGSSTGSTKIYYSYPYVPLGKHWITIWMMGYIKSR